MDQDPWRSRKWMANLAGVVMGAATAAVIVYILAAKALLVHAPAGGFWIVGS
ncbi:MAG TPA: hypothetical protein VEL75_13905 [Candidatus Methylomirabilis sp.]|nr:hypothetical protein [Candidatus Methylomirabilis sp.]